MFLSYNTAASYNTVTAEVNTTLLNAIKEFERSLKSNSFTFETAFGHMLVATENHYETMYVDTYLHTIAHPAVMEVISGMFYIMYGKYHGSDCTEIIMDLDSRFSLGYTEGDSLPVIIDYAEGKFYTPDEGFDEDCTIFSSMSYLHDTEYKFKISQTFKEWADIIESVYTKQEDTTTIKDNLGDLWEDLPF